MITPNTSLPIEAPVYSGTGVLAGAPFRRVVAAIMRAERVEQAARASVYTRVLLLLTVLGATFRNYWTYSHYEHLDPSVWISFVNGTGLAPEQYRVGVKLVAWWLMHHAGGGFRHSFTLLDLAGLSVAGLLLQTLLERSRAYREADKALQWLASAAFLALFFYYLSWLPWFQCAETLPSVGMTAGLLFLWSKRPEAEPSAGGASAHTGTVCGVLLLTLAQALVRADLACTVGLGMLLAATQRPYAESFSLPRKLAITIAGTCALLSAGVQVYMMRVAYPHATYGKTPVFMLRHDAADPFVIGPFVLFLVPFVWTAAVVLKQRRTDTTGQGSPDTKRDGAQMGLLLGSLLYLPLWMALGKLDEVRIFLPFALTLTPLSTELLLGGVEQGNIVHGRPESYSGNDAI